MTGVCNICREKSARCIVSPFDFHHAGAKLRIALMNESKEEASRLAAQHVKMEIALQLQFQSGILTDMDKWVHYL